MSDNVKGITSDPIYGTQNINFEENLNFFEGKEITIEKPEEELPEEKKAEIEGMERLILSFNKIKLEDLPEHDGQEGFTDFVKSAFISLWELVKDIGRWIKSLFMNKLVRLETSIKFTEQRRKLYGVKDGQEVKFPFSAMRIAIPSKFTETGDWVYQCAAIDMGVFDSALSVSKMLRNFITDDIQDLNSKKFETMAFIAKALTKGTLVEGGLCGTDIVSGNRVFTVRAPLYENPQAALTYFADSNVAMSLKKPTYVVTGPLIDNIIKTMKDYVRLITRYQTNTSELQKAFELEVGRIIKSETSSIVVKSYLAWLVGVHKRLVNSMVQHACQVIEAMDDVANAGIK